MKKLLHISIFFIAIACFAACEYETIEPVKVTVGNVAFKTDVYPLFVRCKTCHPSVKATFDATDDTKAYTTLTTNNLVSKPAASCKLVDYVNKGHQTASSYSAEEKAKIAKWVEDGFLNN